jgi:hypothetical protein
VNEHTLNANAGHRLRALRPSKNVRQSNAADVRGASPASLNLIQKGKCGTRLPPLGQALHLSEVDPTE